MRHAVLMMTAAAMILGACATTPSDNSARAEPVVADTTPAPPPVNATVLPANTQIRVRLQSDLGPAINRVGDTFTVEVVETLLAQNGGTLLGEGTVITAMVTGVEPSDEPGDIAAIRLNFLRMTRDGVLHPLTANIVRTEYEEASTEDVANAPFGFVIGGELLARLVDEAMGRGAGTVISLGHGAVDQVMPAGTQMTIRTIDSIDLSL